MNIEHFYKQVTRLGNVFIALCLLVLNIGSVQIVQAVTSDTTVDSITPNGLEGKNSPNLSSQYSNFVNSKILAQSTTTVTIFDDVADAEVLNIYCISSWDTCRNAWVGNAIFQGESLGAVAAAVDSNGYHIKRVFFFFDTSSISTNSQITNVTLSVYAGQYLDGNKTIHVVRSTAAIPLTTADFSKIEYVSGGSTTLAFPNTWMGINLNSNALSWITKGGVTKLALIHNLDLNNIAPSGQNGVIVGLAENPQYRPYLTVTYIPPHVTISGNAGTTGVTLSYIDGTARTVISDSNGNYLISVPQGWSGTVMPSKTGFAFSPVSRVYSLIQTNQTSQDYTAFGDLTNSYWAWQYIERLYNAGITGGCSVNPLSYCPEDSVTRAQMAVFLEKGVHYPFSFTAPNVPPTFNDTIGHWAEDWIEALKSDGITSGCATGLYCPDNPVTRAQMAVFLLKAKYGSSYLPPSVGASTGFGDVPTTYWAAAWIKQLAAEQITSGCGNGNYCPENPVTRAQMAVFLVKTFSLP